MTPDTAGTEAELPQGGRDGMIVTDGGRFGGYGLYLLAGKPVFLSNLLDLKRVRSEGTVVLSPGRHVLEYNVKNDGLDFATLAFNNISGLGTPGTGTFKVDVKVVLSQRLDHTVPLTLPWDETFDIGSDAGTPVDDQDCQVPFAFSGKVDKLTFAIQPPQSTPEGVQKLKEAEARGADAQ